MLTWSKKKKNVSKFAGEIFCLAECDKMTILPILHYTFTNTTFPLALTKWAYFGLKSFCSIIIMLRKRDRKKKLKYAERLLIMILFWTWVVFQQIAVQGAYVTRVKMLHGCYVYTIYTRGVLLIVGSERVNCIKFWTWVVLHHASSKKACFSEIWKVDFYSISDFEWQYY